MVSLIFQLATILGIAAVLALIAKMIKQPTIIAYLVTGIIAGPLFLGLISYDNVMESISHIAIAFLLFIVGISLDFRILKKFGKVSFVVGIGQVVLTTLIGFFIGQWFGFDYIGSILIALALSFSSTFVVVKIITDKKELDSLHGKISLGILIVQDFVAALVLTIAPVLKSGTEFIILTQLGKVALLIGAVFLFAHFIIHGLLSVAAKNSEILFLFGLSWALLIAFLFDFAGFSLEIGALIAGMSLAHSKYSLMISSKTQGLRDFFVLLFFVFFGSFLIGPFTYQTIFAVIAFSALVLIGNPIIIMGLMKLFGYTKRTNFFTGLTLAQISEFSLVFILLGFKIGLISQQILSIIIMVAVITIALSSYSMFYSHYLYRLSSPLLGIFDSKRAKVSVHKNARYDTILFGYNRIGFSLLNALGKGKKSYLVVDYDPETISLLTKKKINCVYGDANDAELLEEVNLKDAKLVLSTIPDLDVNLVILKSLDLSRTSFMPTAHSISDAEKLYEQGADYVIMPHFLGGEYVSDLLLQTGFDKKKISSEGKKQKSRLAERAVEGHRHPTSDYHGD